MCAARSRINAVGDLITETVRLDLDEDNARGQCTRTMYEDNV